MSIREKVDQLLESFFQERTELFPVSVQVSPANAIRITIDGDHGVTLQDCLDTSRHIEGNLDREEEDYSLEVGSPGATEPMVQPRQYTKNVGREIEVTFTDGSVKSGVLESIGENGIMLYQKYRKPKEIGKGKITVEETEEIPFERISKSIVVLKF